MNLQAVRPVIDAVIYEGCVLYPYQANGDKDKQCWCFGGIYPQQYFNASGGAAPCHMQTQCLIEAKPDNRLQVMLRFLQSQVREVGRMAQPLTEWPTDQEPDFTIVPTLAVDEAQYYGWQEALERDVPVLDCPLQALLSQPFQLHFSFQGQRELQPIRNELGHCCGVSLHARQEISGIVTVRAQDCGDNCYRLTVRIENHSPIEHPERLTHDRASQYAFASTHTVFASSGGRFVSLMDPPKHLKKLAAACVNEGTYPVLVGKQEARDTLLSAPIVLYDFPELVPSGSGCLIRQHRNRRDLEPDYLNHRR